MKPRSSESSRPEREPFYRYGSFETGHEVKTVPIYHIKPEAVLIDRSELLELEEWALESSPSTTIQPEIFEPVRLAALEGENGLRVIDGFYRLQAMRNFSIKKVQATVEPMSYAALLDQRMCLAKDHPSLKFGRVSKWVKEAWRLSPLANRQNINATEAFAMAYSGKNLYQLEPTVADQIKLWVKEKSEKWGFQVGNIYHYLSVDDALSPQVASMVRTGVLRTENSGLLNFTQAEAIAHHLTIDKKHQARFAAIVTGMNLKTEEIKQLAAGLSKLDNIQSIDFMLGFIEKSNPNLVEDKRNTFNLQEIGIDQQALTVGEINLARFHLGSKGLLRPTAEVLLALRKLLDDRLNVNRQRDKLPEVAESLTQVAKMTITLAQLAEVLAGTNPSLTSKRNNTTDS
jgi:hypothetical protein